MTTEQKLNSSEILRLCPKPLHDDTVRNFTKRITKAWELCSDSITENKFLSLCVINGGPYAPAMETYISESTAPTVTLMCQQLLKIYDYTQAEYVAEFKSATILPGENVARFAQRLKSLFMKAYKVSGSPSELSVGERRLLVESFLDALPHSDGRLLRLVATQSELLDVDKLAIRASRTIRRTVSESPVTTIGDKPDDEEKQSSEDECSALDFIL